MPGLWPRLHLARHAVADVQIWNVRLENGSKARTVATRAQQRRSGLKRNRGTPGQPKQRRQNRILNDFYFQEAKRCNYLSRAAFKLIQIDEKFHVLKKHGFVLDLGCFPGSWLQVACERLGPRIAADPEQPNKRLGGAVVGIDLKEMDPPQRHCDERVTVLHGDARSLAPAALTAHCGGGGFHTVLSDMCHDTMGAAAADVDASLSLCELAATIAVGNGFALTDEELEGLPREPREEARTWRRGVLRQGGALVMKILEGAGTKEFADSLRPYFEKVGFLRPKATRKESREVYLVCVKHKAPPSV